MRSFLPVFMVFVLLAIEPLLGSLSAFGGRGLSEWMPVLRGVQVFLMLILLPVPFLVVLKRMTFSQAFRTGIRRYFSSGGGLAGFVLTSGLILTFLFFLARRVPAVGSLVWPGFVFGQGAVLLRIALSCVVVIAIVRILKKTDGYDPQSASSESVR